MKRSKKWFLLGLGTIIFLLVKLTVSFSFGYYKGYHYRDAECEQMSQSLKNCQEEIRELREKKLNSAPVPAR